MVRQELYDLVWSEPMIKLGARFGISGNGLKKACKRASIPVPPQGYWNKLQAAPLIGGRLGMKKKLRRARSQCTGSTGVRGDIRKGHEAR